MHEFSVRTIALEGIKVVFVEVQVQISNGLPAFKIVGLADKAVSESRERVRAALFSMGLALPPKRVLVNLAPADIPKEGSHYDLPIAIGILVALQLLDAEQSAEAVIVGELGLNGKLLAVPGILPAAIAANENGNCLVCPFFNAAEARLSGLSAITAAESLQQLLQHWRKGDPLPELPEVKPPAHSNNNDWQAIRGQSAAKRAAEIAMAGGHSLMMFGPPGVGKSMLAQSLPAIAPPLSPAEKLETALLWSVAGMGQYQHQAGSARPFRNPHHTASTVALIGGGARAKPGEVSLAHNGILFLDELPEYNRATLEALRQPIESGEAVIARANSHTTYPAVFQLVAAMNPCHCGYLDDPQRRCNQVPNCGIKYQSRISGPLWERFDLCCQVTDVAITDLAVAAPLESAQAVAQRVSQARTMQTERYIARGKNQNPASINSTKRKQTADDLQLRQNDAFFDSGIFTSSELVRNATNARATVEDLEQNLALSESGKQLLNIMAERQHLSARGWFRVLRVARTIADLAGSEGVQRLHVAEALSYRRAGLRY